MIETESTTGGLLRKLLRTALMVLFANWELNEKL